MAFQDKNLIIKESNLPGAGMGLFTKKFISKGTRITEYLGRHTNWDDVKDDDHNGYIFYIDDDHVIDAGKNKKSVARYANDARGITKVKGLTNNTEYTNEDNRIYIDAVKDIEAGGEIFVGYGKAYWDTVRENIAIDKKSAKK